MIYCTASISCCKISMQSAKHPQLDAHHLQVRLHECPEDVELVLQLTHHIRLQSNKFLQCDTS